MAMSSSLSLPFHPTQINANNDYLEVRVKLWHLDAKQPVELIEE